MQGQNLSNILKTVVNFFKKEVKKSSDQSGFTQRNRKLNSSLFIETLVISTLSDGQCSLEQMCRLIRRRGVEITKQGLHFRFNTGATELMKMLFEKGLNHFRGSYKEPLGLLRPFTTVKIIDSSGWKLPSKLEPLYKGFGGASSTAGLKMQTIFNYTEGQIKLIELTGATKNDQSFKGHLEEIQQGELYLQDLGYFNIRSFSGIANKGAYFVSRYLSHTKIFNVLTENEIDLLNVLQKSGHYFSDCVYIGRSEKLKVRITAKRLDQGSIEKRHRNIHREAKKKGCTPSKETLALAEWSIFVTNVPNKWLKDNELHLIYSLRWQIELFYKLCKSGANIHKTNGRTSPRVICELYAKLICIVVFLFLCNPIRLLENKELSFYKGYKLFREQAHTFFKALTSAYLLKKFLAQYLNDLYWYAMKDKGKRKEPSTYQKLVAYDNAA